VRRAIAEESGYDGARLVAAERSERVQALYRQFSEEAEKLGVFGAPTFVLEGELFWGQDRLAFVDRALEAIRIREAQPTQR
jgi:2-hydroxychromene-2-carboxylate isomerase